jgi:hypothetical protein
LTPLYAPSRTARRLARDDDGKPPSRRWQGGFKGCELAGGSGMSGECSRNVFSVWYTGGRGLTHRCPAEPCMAPIIWAGAGIFSPPPIPPSGMNGGAAGVSISNIAAILVPGGPGGGGVIFAERAVGQRYGRRVGLSGCVDSPSAAMESACIQSSIQPLVNQPHSRLRCTWAGPVHHAPLETTAVTG